MSISKLKSGRWRAQVHIPGKGNVSVSRIIGGPGSYRTKGEAKAAREQARARLGSARHDVTVGQFRERWISDPLFARPRQSTMVCYEERTKQFAEHYANVPIALISDDVVAGWLATGTRPVSVVDTLRTMFNDAASTEAGKLVTHNPFAGLKLRRPTPKEWKLDERSRAALDEQARLLAPPSFAAYLRFGCLAALRPSELDALKLEDVDFDAGEIHVCRQWNARTQTYTPPKYGSYLAALTDEARQVLEQCPRDHDGPWAFMTTRGTHYRPSSRTHHWDRVRYAAGLGDVTINRAMRHYFAWYGLNVLGLPPHVVAEQLGHKDGGKLIVSTYGHPSAAVARRRIRDAYRDAGNVRQLPTRQETA